MRASAPVFVIEREGAGFRVSRDTLEANHVAVYRRDPAHGVVDVVLPVGPGRSAALFRAADAEMLVLRLVGDSLTWSVRRADGSMTPMPARAIADLGAEETRVSVSAGESRAAFVISGWDVVVPDTIGPARNMFAGQLPAELLREAVVVETDTQTLAPAVRACGAAALERDRYLFVKCGRADGVEGWFLVDLAASSSLVAKSFVPESQPIEPMSAIEHSAGGVRRLPYSPEGATGSVQGVLGASAFPSLRFGDVVVERAELTVLDRLPDAFGRPVAGILGMDVLRGCERIALEFPRSGAPRLALGAAPSGARPAAVTPFAWVASHLLVAGEIGGRRARWILDSGAPRTVVDSVGAPAFEAHAAAPIGGLGGRKLGALRARAASARAGALDLGGLECDVAPLDVFASLRQPGLALGLLGLADLARCARIEVDFRARVIRWFR